MADETAAAILALQDEVKRLRRDLENLRVEALHNRLRFHSPGDDTARADGLASHLEAHFYTSGATIVFQMRDRIAGAWRTATLT